MSGVVILGRSLMSMNALLLRSSSGVEYCIVINPSVCLSVHEHISGTAGPIGVKFCCADPLWPWLAFPPAVLRYIMYFEFYG